MTKTPGGTPYAKKQFELRGVYYSTTMVTITWMQDNLVRFGANSIELSEFT